ncbi:MAG: four helix bundle protein [Sulfurimonadaceae bacterium]
MHKKLDVWQNSMHCVTNIYALTKQFPADERFGLTDQIRRAAVSIPSNIAEGSARHSNKEFTQFLYIALGSASEVETQLLIAKNLNYVDSIDALYNDLQSIKRMLLGLIKSKQNKDS